jgi:DNA-binding response OmpR family regulator
VKCPCCSQPMPPAPLVVDLDSNIITDGKLKVRLRPSVAEVAFKLVEAMPAVVFYEKLYTGRSRVKESNDPQKVVQVYVHQLRIVLAHMGFRIDYAYGTGYRIVRDAGNEVIDQVDLIKQRQVLKSEKVVRIK